MTNRDRLSEVRADALLSDSVCKFIFPLTPRRVLFLDSLPQWRRLALFEAVFFLAYGFAMNLAPRAGAPFWLPDSVLLCALLLEEPKHWWAYLLAPLPVRFLVAVPPGLPAWFLLAAFINDSLKGLVGAYLMRRALHGRMIRFEALYDLWVYWLMAVLLAPAISGLAGAGAWSAMGHAFWPTWRQWFLGDALANLVCTPLLLLLAQDWRKFGTTSAARSAEALLLFTALPFATQLARQGIGKGGFINPLGYIPLPFLVWAAVRFGAAGASGALSLMSMVAVAATSGAPETGAMNSTLSIQLFMVVLSIPIVSLSVLVEQQRRTEESLRESEERFRSMADAAPVMIWVSGLDALFTFFNKGWLTFTGRSLQDQLGSGWTASVHPEDVERCLSVYASSFETRTNFQMEYRLRRADGEYRWVLNSGVPRFQPEKGFGGFIGSCVDITDVKRTQESAIARQKLESVGVLAGGIAHDFNNLLGSVLALGELAAEELAAGATPFEEIQRIRDAASRGSEIVRELMIYSGHDKASLEALDVSQIVRDTMELIKVSISKHCVLRTDLRDDLPCVRGSAPQIRQIVMNLIINASEAIGGAEGVIAIATSHAAGNLVRLRVEDTGCGMSEAARARIFDPFFTTKFAGRGMGLAVVQGIVRDHGGEIQVTSEPGRGTTFEILLPCTAEAAQPQRGTILLAPVNDNPSQPGTVLVVEDESELRLAVSRMLRKQGFGVMEAADGAAALELFRGRYDEIDVMLLDITLPGVPSRDVFEQARRVRPELKVILTSAYSREMVETSFAGLGIEHFIRKPFQMVQLTNLLQETMTRAMRRSAHSGE